MEGIEMEFIIPGVDGKPGLKLLGRTLKEALTLALDNDVRLDDLTFKDVSLEGFVAMGAGFRGSQFKDLALSGAVMPGCGFRFSLWMQVSAMGVYFSGSVFAFSRVSDSAFDGASLAGSDWRSAKFTRVSFRGCDLSGVLTDAQTTFTDCDFSGAKLRGTNIEHP